MSAKTTHKGASMKRRDWLALEMAMLGSAVPSPDAIMRLGWMRQTGFVQARVEPLRGPYSMAVAVK